MAGASARLPEAAEAEDGVLANALLESVLLHARALADFFVLDRGYPTDIKRTDFAPAWTPQPADAAQRVQDNYRDLDKHLAHLTWARVEAAQPPWSYLDIVTDLAGIADRWWRHLHKADSDLAAVLRPQVFEALQTARRLED